MFRNIKYLSLTCKKCTNIILLFILTYASKVNGQTTFSCTPFCYLTNNDLDISGNQITVEAFFSLNSLQPGNNILSKHSGPSDANYILRPFSFEFTTTNGFVSVGVPWPYQLGVMYHIAGVYDGVYGYFYINGCLIDKKPMTGNLHNNDWPLLVGDHPLGGEFYDGLIDEIRIWDIARTQSELQQTIATIPSPTTQTGLIAYYQFNGNYINNQGNSMWDFTPQGPASIVNYTPPTFNLNSVLTATNVSCNGANNGSIVITTIGNTSPYSYSIDNGTNYQTSNTFSSLGIGTHTIITKSDLGCVVSETVSITEPTILQISLVNAKSPSCNNGNDGRIEVASNGGTGTHAYTWIHNGNTLSVTTNSSNTLPSGSYTIEVKDANNCVATQTLTLSNPAVLTSTISTQKNESCNGVNDGFALITASGGGGSYTYTWTTTPSQNTALANTLGAGIYTVSIEDANTCIVTNTVNITTNPYPNVNFSFTPVCAKANAAFTNLSSITSGTYTCNWSLGTIPNTTSASFDTLYAYQTCGKYEVILTCTSDSNCVAFKKDSIEIYCLPNPQFTYSDSCVSPTIVFNNQSTNATGYSWDFGDGNTDNNTNTTHAYSISGTYTVTLINTNSNCSDSIKKSIGIYDIPSVDFNVYGACEGDDYFFESIAIIPNPNSISDWQWDFENDGTIDVTGTDNTLKVFSLGGNFTGKLIVVSDKGCKDSIIKPFTVNPKPDVNFTFSNACEGSTVMFTNTSTIIAPGSIANSYWINDVNVENTTDASFTFNTHDSYPIQLVVFSDAGCIDSLTQTIDIYANPKADFSYDMSEGCSPLCITFTDSSSVDTNPGNSSIMSYFWDFADGGTDTVPSLWYCYIESVPNVSLTVTTNNGCSNTIAKGPITVYPSPQAGYEIISTELNLTAPTVTLKDSSSGGSDMLWKFGDGNLILDPTFGDETIYSYNDTGTYRITQIVTSPNGCIDSLIQEVRIKPGASIYVPNCFTPNNDGKNDEFYAKGTGIIEYKLEISNRWGQVLFSTTEMNDGWTGKHNGELVKDGVYVWQIEYRDIFRKPHLINGYVTLLGKPK